MDRNFFYILSYPRCRSTWMSFFMTTNVSYCHHEVLSGNNKDAFEQYMKHFPQLYVGSADTNPISFSKSMRAPGKLVLIRRKPSDVKKSILKAFDKHPSFTDKEWDKYLDNTLAMFTILLDVYSAKEPCLQLDFKELEDVDKLVGLFQYCVPTDISKYHVETLNTTRITVKRREGMQNGIAASCKNIGKTVEEFKEIHIRDFDPEVFKKSVLSGWTELPDNRSSLISSSGGSGNGRIIRP